MTDYLELSRWDLIFVTEEELEDRHRESFFDGDNAPINFEDIEYYMSEIFEEYSEYH